jgi:predicted dehydrogenase
MRPLSRRDFLNSSTVAAALAAAGSLVDGLPAEEPKAAKAAKKGLANDRLRVAVIGVRGRGMSHVGGFTNDALNCEVATICDCDEAVIGNAMKAVEKKQGKPPRYEKDLRRVMDDKSIDIVTIATPNHWHSLAAIWAIQAGKDVYVEKPVSHNVSEGRRVVEAARYYQKICQAGTQSRSTTGMRAAIGYVLSGKIGKVTLSRGLCYKRRESIGKVSGPQQPPKTMDYDLWCGPAPNKPPMRNTKFGTVHYDWHWIWDYGNGDLGNQGIHEMDKARWGLGKNTLPNSVISVGGRFGYVDDGETANTQICVYDYGDCELIFEVRGLPTGDYKGAKVGNIFVGPDGYVVCPNYSSGVAYSNSGEVVQKFTGGNEGAHFANFIDAVRSRKRELLNGDIEEGHLSSALCHLGNISYRLGQLAPLGVDPAEFASDKLAAETLVRMREHLKDNKVSPETTQYHVGPRLTLEPKTESFVGQGSEPANAMLTREYRKGFEVPAKIG